jgi:hypothetical protein
VPVEPCDLYLSAFPDTDQLDLAEINTLKIELLVRGLGVQVPLGAQLIMALTWCFTPGQSFYTSMVDDGVIRV